MDARRIAGVAVRSPRALDLTPDLIARCHRPEPEVGHDPGLTLLTQETREEAAERLHGDRPSGPLWVFAYGSLIWQPGFAVAEWRRGTLVGWHRSFCMELRYWRGSPASPGLMMALVRGGCCNGLLARVPEGAERATLGALIRREFDYLEDLVTIRWATARTADGPVRALVVWAGPSGPDIVNGLPLPEVARRITLACGHIGSNAEYLYRTVACLEEHGIRDRSLWQLQRLVANEIRSSAFDGEGARRDPDRVHATTTDASARLAR